MFFIQMFCNFLSLTMMSRYCVAQVYQYCNNQLTKSIYNGKSYYTHPSSGKTIKQSLSQATPKNAMKKRAVSQLSTPEWMVLRTETGIRHRLLWKPEVWPSFLQLKCQFITVIILYTVCSIPQWAANVISSQHPGVYGFYLHLGIHHSDSHVLNSRSNTPHHPPCPCAFAASEY